MLKNRDAKQPYNDLADKTFEELETRRTCTDAPTQQFFTLYGFKWINIVFASLADAENGGDGSCPGGCHDRVRSLCKAGRCVVPTCADVETHCLVDSKEGERARLWCPSQMFSFHAFGAGVHLQVPKDLWVRGPLWRIGCPTRMPNFLPCQGRGAAQGRAMCRCTVGFS